jgi:hypothetical protein
MLSHDAGQQPRPLVMVHLARMSSQHNVHCREIGRSDKVWGSVEKGRSRDLSRLPEWVIENTRTDIKL